MLNLSRSFYDEAEKMGKRRVCWVRTEDGQWIRSYDPATVSAVKKRLEVESERLLLKYIKSNH